MKLPFNTNHKPVYLFKFSYESQIYFNKSLTDFASSDYI